VSQGWIVMRGKYVFICRSQQYPTTPRMYLLVSIDQKVVEMRGGGRFGYSIETTQKIANAQPAGD